MSTDSDQKHPTPNAPKHLRVSGFVEHYAPANFLFRLNLDETEGLTVAATDITVFSTHVEDRVVYFVEALLPHTPELAEALEARKNLFVETGKANTLQMNSAGQGQFVQFGEVIVTPPGHPPKGHEFDGFRQVVALRVSPIN